MRSQETVLHCYIIQLWSCTYLYLQLPVWRVSPQIITSLHVCLYACPQALNYLTHPHTHTHTAQYLLRVRNPNTTDVGSQYEGIVEVFHNGAWGTICNTQWTLNDALVACRTVGFSSAVRAVTDGSYYGAGLGSVYLNDVHCTGEETTLFNCSHSSWGNVPSSCDHSNDAAVVCSDSK